MSVATLKRRPGFVLLLIAYLGFISLGLPDGTLGIAWPSLRTTFGLPLDAIGTILASTGIGYMVSSFNSGRILARFGVGRLLLISSLLMATSLFGYAIAPFWWMFLICGVVAGLGSGAIDAGLNAYAANNFGNRHINWLHACYGLGATLGPLIMITPLQLGYAWRWGYVVVGLILSLMTVVFAFTLSLWESSHTSSENNTPSEQVSAFVTLQHPIVWLHICLFFIYTGLEVTAGQLTYTLFTESRGVDGALAGVWVSIYWGSLTVGRIVFGVLTERFNEHHLLRASMLFLIIGATLVSLPNIPLLSFVGLALMGFTLAPIFPLLMAQTPQRLGQGRAMHAVGFQVSAAMLGAAALPALISTLAQRVNLEVVGPALCVMGIVLIVLYEITLRTTKAL
ncbi:MAG: MFS transporter [Chloroflexi bacterium AL-W]|nr:MFS transporter [Chloroflexi bacterium AL-N1]NOK67209.1 MFS transporter [Chloroflexi bacterium AL-N10]NOK75297.1 MFS transporter [Chloroflexi bacterium AL-N5]NOK82085.1 MFS transporter [Chloroflexi bacterium AL-W]NOK89930.1 MFS transporter [Chloroflexi bacterium AL-N15]